MNQAVFFVAVILAVGYAATVPENKGASPLLPSNATALPAATKDEPLSPDFKGWVCQGGNRTCVGPTQIELPNGQWRDSKADDPCTCLDIATQTPDCSGKIVEADS